MVKNICLQCRRPWFNLWVGKICWRREWQPTPIFLPGEIHGQWSLAVYSPWDHKELDTTEWLTLSLSMLVSSGEGVELSVFPSASNPPFAAALQPTHSLANLYTLGWYSMHSHLLFYWSLKTRWRRWWMYWGQVLFNPALVDECPESTVHTVSEHSWWTICSMIFSYFCIAFCSLKCPSKNNIWRSHLRSYTTWGGGGVVHMDEGGAVRGAGRRLSSPNRTGARSDADMMALSQYPHRIPFCLEWGPKLLVFRTPGGFLEVCTEEGIISIYYNNII